MLDGIHSLALRGIAKGVDVKGDAPAVQHLAAAGLIQPVDGAWALTQAGQAVLELEGGGNGGDGTDVMSKIRAWFMT
jgi:hypothetical protein